MKKNLLILALLAGSVGMSQAGALLTEDFNDVSTLAGKGWVQTNTSVPVGTTGWFQGNTAIFVAASGPENSYVAANFLNAGPNGIVSNWLLTPTVTIVNGEALNFSLRLLGEGLLDTVEVYISTSGASIVLANFQLLGAFSSSSDTGWTSESIFYSGAFNGTGRYAFRYFVADTSINGNYVGIDNVSVVNANVSVVPEPASAALFGIAILALALSRRKVAVKQ